MVIRIFEEFRMMKVKIINCVYKKYDLKNIDFTVFQRLIFPARCAPRLLSICARVLDFNSVNWVFCIGILFSWQCRITNKTDFLDIQTHCSRNQQLIVSNQGVNQQNSTFRKQFFDNIIILVSCFGELIGKVYQKSLSVKTTCSINRIGALIINLFFFFRK